VASLYVEVTAKTDGVTSGLNSVKGQVENTGGAFSNFAGSVTKAIGAITAEAAILNTVFDFGEAGAQVLQVEQSFQALLTTVGGAPDTLNQMRSAVQGTASDMQLMVSASTFLAGTTGDLGSAFADALPELAAVARAASLLNPTVGGTGEAFNRLALGIKKAEPELLDEIGILLNLNTVYKDFAPSVGKSADELTKSEKSMAMLNAVMAQGSTLIAQAGNAANDSATKIAQMQAALDNAGNAVKSTFAPAIASAASVITLLLTGTEQVNDALTEHASEVTHTATTYSEYISELQRAAEVAGYTVNATGDLVQTYNEQGIEIEQLVQENYALSQSEWASAKAAESMSGAMDELSGGLSRIGEAALETSEVVWDGSESWSAYGARLTEAAEAAGYTATTMDELTIMAAGLAAGLEGTLGDAMADYSESLGELTLQETDLTAKLQELQAAGLDPTNAKYQELTEALRENATAQSEALASLQGLTAETIYQQAAMGLDTQASLDLARSMGVLSEADYATASAVQSLRNEFDTNHDSMISAAEGAQDYAAGIELINRAVQSLQAKNMPVTLDNIANEMQALAQSDADAALAGTAAAAGDASNPLADVAGAAADASGTVGDLASSTEDQNSALDQVQGAANRARIGIDSVRTAASNAANPLRVAASAASDLANALESIPSNKVIRVSATGFDAAISAINSLTGALNSIPNDVTATVSVNFEDGGGSGTSGTSSTSAPSTTNSAAPTLSQTFNVYNPLAAAMLMEQQAGAARQRMEALMNG
jgi:hypothetical protein